MKPLWIELVTDGVANRFDMGDYELIELHYKLTEYPKLYYNILQHELSHADGDFKSEDLIHDLKSKTPGLFKFMRENPSTWNQVLPLYYNKRRKSWIYDWSAITSWLMIGSIATVFYWIAGTIL
jgi:hypothetical protein